MGDYRKRALNALEIARQIPDLDTAAKFRRLAHRYVVLARSYGEGISPPEGRESVVSLDGESFARASAAKARGSAI